MSRRVSREVERNGITSMDSIPVQLRNVVQELESAPNLSPRDIAAGLFLVRLGDSLHGAFNASFLTLSLINQLREKLNMTDMTLELDVFHTRWSFRQGTVADVHYISWDYDMYSVSVLTKIGRGVLNGSLTPTDGLKMIREHEIKSDYPRFEGWYRYFPSRMFIIPLMAASCATVFFGGTWLDFGFAAACGMAAGIIAWIGTLHKQLLSVMDYLAGVVAAMIGVAAFTAYPDSVCFTAELIGTLFWFLYGVAFVVSLVEITNNQLIVGFTRFGFATVKSYGLAFGAVLGVWLAAYGDKDRLDAIVGQECDQLDHQINEIWLLLLFPMSATASLMQMRVSLKNWPICFIVQSIAYGSQYVLTRVWKYPDILANLIPAFLATLASHVCVLLFFRLKWDDLNDTRHFFAEMGKTEEVKLAQSTSPSLHDLVEIEKENGGCTLLSVETPISVSDSLNGNHTAEGTNCVDHNADNGVGESGMSTVTFINDNNNEYAEEDKLSHEHSGTWFCLLPALYLLVPGSKLLQNAVLALLASASNADVVALESLASSWFVIGLSQAVGLRLGFAFLWACSELWKRLCNRRSCLPLPAS